jgi:hypothetical protein
LVQSYADERKLTYYFASVTTKWDAILRCQTWHIWPEAFAAELSGIPVEYGGESRLPVNVVIDSYVPRSDPASFVTEETDKGPPLWDGEMHGLHRVWDLVLKAPEDTIPVTTQLRRARRGDVDIILDFEFEGDELPPAVVDALRATAYEIMSLLSLRLGDFLTPALPFEIRRLPGGGLAQLDVTHTVAVRERHDLVVDQLEQPLFDVAHFLTDPRFGPKFRIALELYAAHFAERQVRVRFILLVIAMEALAQAKDKHPVAVGLLSRWAKELNEEIAKHDHSTEAYRSLNSLAGQLNRLKEESIGVQIGNLFADLPGVSPEEIAKLKRRARDLYNERSTLVHNGYLPADKLPELEEEARVLVEMLFRSAIEQSQPEGEQFKVVRPGDE